jgi:hypothetical protein
MVVIFLQFVEPALQHVRSTMPDTFHNMLMDVQCDVGGGAWVSRLAAGNVIELNYKLHGVAMMLTSTVLKCPFLTPLLSPVEQNRPLGRGTAAACHWLNCYQ